MPALVKDQKKRWPGTVPYKIGDLSENYTVGKALPMTEVGLRVCLDEFNAAVGADVFVEHTSQKNYLVFKYGGLSLSIGMQGGEQVCRITSRNAFHEMGHAIGLGHSYFHTWSRLPSLFEGIDKQNYDLKRGELEDYMGPNMPSMMGYTPDVFNDSPRIKRVVNVINNQKTGLGGARMRAVARLFSLRAQNLLREAPPDKLKKKRKSPYFTPPPLPSDINNMTQPELKQLIDDLDIVREYWTFETGFEMKVHPIDKNAVRQALGVAQSWHGSTLGDRLQQRERGTLVRPKVLTVT